MAGSQKLTPPSSATAGESSAPPHTDRPNAMPALAATRMYLTALRRAGPTSELDEKTQPTVRDMINSPAKSGTRAPGEPHHCARRRPTIDNWGQHLGFRGPVAAEAHATSLRGASSVRTIRRVSCERASGASLPLRAARQRTARTQEARSAAPRGVAQMAETQPQTKPRVRRAAAGTASHDEAGAAPWGTMLPRRRRISFSSRCARRLRAVASLTS